MNPNQPDQNQGGWQQQPTAPPDPQAAYGPQPEPSYAVDYLDQIAPPPARPGFFSGSFTRILIILGVVFVFAVGIIVVLGNQKGTGPTEEMAIKLENMQRVADDTKIYLKSGKLRATNAIYISWLNNTDRDAYDLIQRAGIKKTQMDKKMMSKESDAKSKLTDKFYNGRLNADLDRIYAEEMAFQTKTLKTELDSIAKHGPAKAFKDFAKNASANLTPIQKAFEDFDPSKD